MGIWALIPLGACIAYILVFALTLQGINKRVNRAFAYYLGLAAFWSFTSFMLRLQSVPEFALLWNRILAVALIAGLIAYYHFARLYAGRSPGRGVYLGYLALPVLAVISVSTNWVIESSYIEDGALHHKLGMAIYAIGALSLFYALSVLLLLKGKYRQSRDPIERNRTAYLLAGWGIMAPLVYTNLIPVVKALPLDHIGSLINIAIIAIAITRYDLLDIRLLARRSLGWFILLIIFSGLYASLLLAGLRYFPAIPTVALFTGVSILVIWLFIAARPYWQRIEGVIDRLFYRHTYDYRQSLAGYCQRMNGNLNLDELAHELLPTLTNAININQSYLLLTDSDSGRFHTRYVYPEADEITGGQALSIDPDSPVINWLNKHNSHLNLENIDKTPQFKALWISEREQLEKPGVKMLFPVKSRGKLVAIIALGAKRTRQLYVAEDISIVEGIAREVGIILENAQLYNFAMIKANTDELTGLYNHRHFHERLEQEIARGSRFGSTFSLVMFDIDLFKVYNDIYGHLAGDQVLRRVAKYIGASIRNIDLAFRYGGEEFAIILPETTLQDAYKAAERIRKTIEAKTSSKAMPVTMSAGIASWPSDGVMREEVIGAADAALYQAKNTGRNRTCLSIEVANGTKNGCAVESDGSSRSINIIYALAATVDAKDSYTYGHSRKVSEYAVAIAEELNLPEKLVATIRTAGLLHDIGKIGISDSILNKKESLTSSDWEPIKTHPQIGYEILRHVIELTDCLPMILHHHERYDGMGYPSGLRGENIPEGARILAIADAYDAMTTLRPYRGKWTQEEALLELEKNAGTQFDAELVSVFCKITRLALPDNGV